MNEDLEATRIPLHDVPVALIVQEMTKENMAVSRGMQQACCKAVSLTSLPTTVRAFSAQAVSMKPLHTDTT